MSTRLIVSAVVGVAVGYFAGPQAGIQAFSLTYGVTGGLDPNKKVQGPRLDDLKMASASYGAPVAYVEGHPRIAGNIVWSTDKREVATETSDGGKGGPGVEFGRAGEVNRAEPPRIAQGEVVAGAGFEHEMVVFADRLWLDSPAPAHPEVEDHRFAAVGVDQAVFGPA